MTNNEEPANPGELREDIPLRPNESTSFSYRFGGIRLIVASFAVLSVAVTIALATQIYYGDFEVVPHGSVATDSQECSRIGTNILKARGNAVDAAIAATFCLAVINQHTTGLDAGGVMMIYDYRHSRLFELPEVPIVINFTDTFTGNIPQLVRGLAFIHDKFGSFEWVELINPSLELARFGFNIPSSLVTAVESTNAKHLFPDIEPGHNYTDASLASYLETIANGNVTTYFSSGRNSGINMSDSAVLEIDDFVIYTPIVETASIMMSYLNVAAHDHNDTDDFQNPIKVYRKAHNLLMTLQNIKSRVPASNVAVIDKNDLYVSLITGLNDVFGSKQRSPYGYIMNEPSTNHITNFVPAIITQKYVCGLRTVLSCGELGGALQVIDSLLEQHKYSSNQLVSALENPRLHIILNAGAIALEDNHDPKFDTEVLTTLRNLGPLTVAQEPYPTCNAVQQLADALSSHSDSRGGGISSRF